MGNFREFNSSGGSGRSRSSSGGSRGGGFRGGSGGRTGGFGGRGRSSSFSDRGSSGGFERRRPEMHEATCSNCGNKCQVPFRPTGNKPVYCSDCFEKMGNSNPRNGDSGRSSGVSKEQLDQINVKLDKIMTSLNLK